MTSELQAIEKGLRTVNLFASLSDLQIRHLASRCRGRSAKKGKVLFREGDQGGSLVIILEGSIAITQETPHGEKLIAVRGAGDVIGEMALLDGKPRSATATVDEDAAMILLDRAAFEGAIKSSSGLAVELLRVLSERIRTIEYGSKTAPLRTRVIEWLVQQVGDDDGPGEVVVIKNTLASRLGVRRETLSRCFSQLQEEGLVKLKSRHVRVPDRARLADEVS